MIHVHGTNPTGPHLPEERERGKMQKIEPSLPQSRILRATCKVVA